MMRRLICDGAAKLSTEIPQKTGHLRRSLVSLSPLTRLAMGPRPSGTRNVRQRRGMQHRGRPRGGRVISGRWHGAQVGPRPRHRTCRPGRGRGLQNRVDTRRGQAYYVAYTHSCESSAGEPHARGPRRPLRLEGLATLALRKLNRQPSEVRVSLARTTRTPMLSPRDRRRCDRGRRARQWGVASARLHTPRCEAQSNPVLERCSLCPP